MDMTMYAEYSPAEVASLQPYGVVVSVHTRRRDAFARWEGKMSRKVSPGLGGEPPAMGVRDCLRPVAAIGLGEDVVYVSLDRGLAYKELLGDLRVG